MAREYKNCTYTGVSQNDAYGRRVRTYRLCHLAGGIKIHDHHRLNIRAEGQVRHHTRATEKDCEIIS